MIVNQLLFVFAAIFQGLSGDKIFYRSPALQEVNLTPDPGQYFIVDDKGSRIDITALSDDRGILYWHRRIKTEVCQTGECKLVDVGLYWDLTGDFFGLDVYGEHLTKTDHSIFSEGDYTKLLDILHNDWSILREYDFAELTNGATEVDRIPGGVDAASGATRKEIASEAVSNAVYTTYTLWHLTHNGEKEQLVAHTIDRFTGGDLIDRILASATDKYTLFLLDLFSQARIESADKLRPLIMDGLRDRGRPHLQNLALKSLNQLEIDADAIQKDIAIAYDAVPADIRLRIIGSLQKVTRISDELYTALQSDVDMENEWFAAKVLDLLRHASAHSPEVLASARRLSKSKNTYARQTADAFLKTVNSHGTPEN